VRHLAILVMLAGCTTYAQRARHNAPGLSDLSTPLPRETGDPDRFEAARDPGSETYMIALGPYVLGGLGRDGGGGEVGTELRFEHHTDDKQGLVAGSSVAITAGFGIAQWFERSSVVPGAFYGELNYRGWVGDKVPLDLGLGPAIYPGEPNVGAQITLRSLGSMLRTRYMSATGLEIMFGYEMPIPFFFQRSR